MNFSLPSHLSRSPGEANEAPFSQEKKGDPATGDANPSWGPLQGWQESHETAAQDIAQARQHLVAQGVCVSPRPAFESSR